jgi:2-dehydro-3-deoxyphosphooctonate aldolase (KDO 8-P synthase)
MNRVVHVGTLSLSNSLPFVLIAGPCAVESKDHSLFMADAIKNVCDKLDVGFIFKSSFDKANRTSWSSARGVGIDDGLDILQRVKSEIGVTTITDVHLPEHCDIVANVVDILQIPAFLCRQTDLLSAAAKTGRPLNVKKGQFLSPYDISNVVDKLNSFGSDQILLCERGVCFGYNNLVVDFRSLPIMANTGYPVIFDATHSVQEPSGLGHCSGGKREFVPILAKAAVSIGVAGLFMEVHDNPDEAICDGPKHAAIEGLSLCLSTPKAA